MRTNRDTPLRTSLLSLSTLGLAMLAMTGCMGTKYLSDGITKDGHVEPHNIVFPALEDAWQTQGQYPNSENLAKIRPGIDKDELYHLIGRPHFSEAQYAREWDYILKFVMPDETVKVCQYKVIFDSEYKGQEFYWQPADCPPQQLTAPSPSALVTVPVTERINLSADALFEFDKWRSQDMLSQGRNDLDQLASELRRYQSLGDTRIIITGHTDRKGDDTYNMTLSQLRAQTVRTYLIDQGVAPSSMIAVGAGESQPIKSCSTDLSRQQEVDCLQPNRRVTLDVSVNQK